MSAALAMTDELAPAPFVYNPLDHKGLIWREVRRWQWAASAGALELSDLEQAGYVGLAEAARKFEPARGWKFSTYAVYWVREKVQREALDRCRTVRVTARAAMAAWKAGDPYPVHSVSLDAPMRADAETSLHDTLLLSTGTEQAENEGESGALVEELRDRVAASIDELPERLAHVVRCRFFRDMTLEETGRELGITRERTRQLQVEALGLLKGRLVSRKVGG